MAEAHGTSDAGNQPNAGGSPADNKQGSTNGTDAGQTRTFSQEDVNRLLADHKRTLKAENDQLRTEVGSLKEQLTPLGEKLASIEAYFTELAKPPGGEDTELDDLSTFDEIEKELTPPAWAKDASDKNLYRHMKRTQLLVRQRDHALNEKLAALEKQAADDRAARDTAEKERGNAELRRREAVKRALLSSIAARVNAVDAKAVQRYFWDDVVYDDKTDRFVLKTENGDLLDAEEGIVAAFPDFLKKPSTTMSGSGANGARTPSPADELKAARDQEAQWLERAQKGRGDQRLIAEYQRAKRRRVELEQKVQTPAQAA